MHYFKKILALITALLCVAIVGTTTSNAADNSSKYLAQIAKNTADILTKVNNLPNYLSGMSKVIEMAISWLQPDDSDTTATLQGQFAAIGKALGDSETNATIKATNQQLLQSLFNISSKEKVTFNSYPDINSFTYPTFMKEPLVPSASGTGTAFIDYIANVGGTSIPHVFPLDSWRGDATSYALYKNLYEVAASVETFNAHTITELYYRNGKDLTTAQEALISKAGNSEWIQEVTTEDLGKVFRQLLMFTAQQYVLTSELVKLQKESLMASVMTNTLLLLNNQKYEFELLNKAQRSK